MKDIGIDDLDVTATKLPQLKSRWKMWVFVFFIGLLCVHFVSTLANSHIPKTENSPDDPSMQTEQAKAQPVQPHAQLAKQGMVRLVAPAERVAAGQKLIEVPLMWIEVDEANAPTDGITDMKLALALYARKPLEPNIPLTFVNLSIAPVAR